MGCINLLYRNQHMLHTGFGITVRKGISLEVGEFLELVFVGLTIAVGLAIMVIFGKWWER